MNQDEIYRLMADSIDYLCMNYEQNPSLAFLAARSGFSEHHFQRVFRRWVGISPKRFIQHLALKEVKKHLMAGLPVLDAAYASNLSSGSRLNDLVLSAEGVRPGMLQQGGQALTLVWGVGLSPFGLCLAAHSGVGLTTLLFVDDDVEAETILRNEWPAATLRRDDDQALHWITQAFALPGGALPQELMLHVRGTNFQLKVWCALLSIPSGSLTTYGALAVTVGSPKASRAVGQAVGVNPVALLIPCHRVINGSGVVGHYRGGAQRKRGLLAWEQAAVDTDASVNV